MPTNGNEVYLTELETRLLSVFISNQILDDQQIVSYLTDLIAKLKK